MQAAKKLALRKVYKIYKLKVSKSQKKIMTSWIHPKNERWGIFQYIKLPQRSFFGRIQDIIFFFAIFWSLREQVFFVNLRFGDNIDLLTLWIGLSPRWSTFIVENIIEAIFLTWGQNIIVVFYSVRLPFHFEIISEIWRFVYRGFYWSNFGLIFLPYLFCSTGKYLSEALIFASTNPTIWQPIVHYTQRYSRLK